MGSVKHHMMEMDDLRGSARGILVEVGALRSCGVGHEMVFSGNGNVADAYPRANAMIKRGELDIGSLSKAEFSALIKDEYDDNSFSSRCPVCEHMKSKD